MFIFSSYTNSFDTDPSLLDHTLQRSAGVAGLRATTPKHQIDVWCFGVFPGEYVSCMVFWWCFSVAIVFLPFFSVWTSSVLLPCTVLVFVYGLNYGGVFVIFHVLSML